jgi:hypothetical protein
LESCNQYLFLFKNLASAFASQAGSMNQATTSVLINHYTAQLSLTNQSPGITWGPENKFQANQVEPQVAAVVNPSWDDYIINLAPHIMNHRKLMDHLKYSVSISTNQSLISTP